MTLLDELAATDPRYPQLEYGSAHLFADWPNRTMDRAAPGVYTIWDAAGAFIYVGMAGKKLEVGYNRTPRQPTRSTLLGRAHGATRLYVAAAVIGSATVADLHACLTLYSAGR